MILLYNLMNKKSKILLIILISSIIISIGVTYYKTIVQQDYEVKKEQLR